MSVCCPDLRSFLVLMLVHNAGLSCRQIHARPGELNHEWSTSGPGFFDHFDDEEQIIQDYICEGLSDGCVPEEILRAQI